MKIRNIIAAAALTTVSSVVAVGGVSGDTQDYEDASCSGTTFVAGGWHSYPVDCYPKYYGGGGSSSIYHQ